MRLRWTQAKLDAFRIRYKEAADELDFMNKKYEEASTKLKDRLASYGIEVLNLKKQLAASKAQWKIIRFPKILCTNIYHKTKILQVAIHNTSSLSFSCLCGCASCGPKKALKGFISMALISMIEEGILFQNLNIKIRFYFLFFVKYYIFIYNVKVLKEFSIF